MAASSRTPPNETLTHFLPKAFAILKAKLEYWVSKEAMDIDFIGPSIIAQLYDLELVSTPIDLYKLTYDDFFKLEAVKEKSATNMYNSIQKSKTMPLSRFVTALSIRHVGKETADLLINEFPTMELLKEASFEQLSAVEGIGDKIAASIFDFFHSIYPRRRFWQRFLTFSHEIGDFQASFYFFLL